ncbi:DUF1501 domain-containing protein [Wenyingzhuangia marina]|uniref:Uncharacterized conserved protein, DUF1501 family n=1 Tax=Wenyingzhuangia marina TaxID=1195760 RepID=A0A1M5WMX3_9FLAO|nr:DUF1501 domain-containing protein [Wenyingzhuangia marina]GGF79455.1 hypothetical protein GCM10011397_23130 [Wenyingzhuangia marina]SHH88930.1 Uncharacterized conserved protein, DUF1501 family [Wenyingzhuangia marina]
MKRRDFLINSSLASGMFFVPSFVSAFEKIPTNLIGHKKLVVIQLSGGNDGLNTVVPYRNDLYYKNRPNISIPKSEILNLNGELGLPPSMSSLKNLYDQGYVSIINNVGYPNPVRSHFRSADIWQTASDANEYKSSGWLGNYLDIYNQESHMAIDVDNKLSLALKGNDKSGIAAFDPKLLYKNASDPFFNKVINKHHMDEHLSEENLGYLYKQMIQAESSASYIFNKSKTYESKANYPKNAFGKQLNTTASFINSHLETKVYYVSMGGFDTHYAETNRHKRLMNILSEGLEVFVNDLKQNNTFKDTLIMVFSEFGRRVEENGSKGTDHGAANNLFLITENLKKPGIYNNHPNLADLDDNGDIKYEIDFRQVYATVLEKWLKADPKKVLGKPFNHLNFI